MWNLPNAGSVGALPSSSGGASVATSACQPTVDQKSEEAKKEGKCISLNAVSPYLSAELLYHKSCYDLIVTLYCCRKDLLQKPCLCWLI
jgi:hypothetical protein